MHYAELFSSQPRVQATTGALYLAPSAGRWPSVCADPSAPPPVSLPGGRWGVGTGCGDREFFQFSPLLTLLQEAILKAWLLHCYFHYWLVASTRHSRQLSSPQLAELQRLTWFTQSELELGLKSVCLTKTIWALISTESALYFLTTFSELLPGDPYLLSVFRLVRFYS